MMDTEQIWSGSTPSFCAIKVFAMAPNICCGDFALERFFTYSGYCVLTNLTHPGQQDVNIGQWYSSLWVKRSMNSLPSSMMVRSAEYVVSKM